MASPIPEPFAKIVQDLNPESDLQGLSGDEAPVEAEPKEEIGEVQAKQEELNSERDDRAENESKLDEKRSDRFNTTSSLTRLRDMLRKRSDKRYNDRQERLKKAEAKKKKAEAEEELLEDTQEAVVDTVQPIASAVATAIASMGPGFGGTDMSAIATLLGTLPNADDEIADQASEDKVPASTTSEPSENTQTPERRVVTKSFTMRSTGSLSTFNFIEGEVTLDGDVIAESGSFFTDGVYLHTMASGGAYGYIDIDEEAEPPTYTVHIDSTGFPAPASGHQIIKFFHVPSETYAGKQTVKMSDMVIYHEGDVHTASEGGDAEWPQTYNTQYMVLQLKTSTSPIETDDLIFDFVRAHS